LQTGLIQDQGPLKLVLS